MRHQMTTVFSLIVIMLTISTLEYQITSDIKSYGEDTDYDKDLIGREKRQLENFDLDDTNQDEQEEPGFWDKVVKVALRLFNKFIEWLNSA